MESLALPSGRTLAWVTYGTPDQSSDLKTIFYFHGFPGCSLEASYLSTHLPKHNARCISIDRPGMGNSTYYDRKITDWPSDVLAVADHLSIPQFYILGISGGAPYALACAHSIPCVDGTTGRLRGIAVVSGMYPTTLSMEGMLPELRTLLFCGAWLPRFATGALLDFLMGRAARSADLKVLEKAMDQAMAKRPETERVVWADADVRAAAVKSTRVAFRQGGAGVAMELMLLGDWGFRLEDIDGKNVKLWHGMLDRNVPVAMAEEAAGLIGCRTCFKEADGHMSMSFNHVEEVLEDLLIEN